MRPLVSEPEGFLESTLDKVERLVELLAEVDRHPLLGRKLALHGGTALNVYHLPLPRLSIDADYTYIGHADVDAYMSERGEIEDALISLVRTMGYHVNEGGKFEHAGRKLQLQYRVGGINENIKFDLTYMNRTPLLPIEGCDCTVVKPPSSIRTLALAEIVAGKVAAYFNRVAFRDLYDLHKLFQLDTLDQTANALGATLARRVILWHVSVSDRYPFAIDGTRAQRFLDHRDDMAESLVPVIRARDRALTIREMAESVDLLLESFVKPRDAVEIEYLERIGLSGDYRPELLFADWPTVLNNARLNPIALRKIDNLSRRPK